MTQYIPIISFVAGLFAGTGFVALGLWLGFRASYDIRNHKEGIDGGGGNFQQGMTAEEEEMIT